MSNEFTIEIKGLDKLMEMANRYPNLSEKHINKAIAGTLSKIKEQAVKNTPKYKGNLKKSWGIRMGRFEGKLVNVARGKDGTPYGYDVEMGRGPHFVSAKELSGWAKSKGLNPWAVSKSIMKKGTKAQHFFKASISNSEEHANKGS